MTHRPNIYTRQRTDKGFLYRVESRILLTEKSIAEDIKVNNIPCNKDLLKALLASENNKVIANKLLYTKALSESMKGKILKDIKK